MGRYKKIHQNVDRVDIWDGQTSTVSVLFSMQICRAYSTKNALEKRDARRLGSAPAADAIDAHRSAIGGPCAGLVVQFACGYCVGAKDKRFLQWDGISGPASRMMLCRERRTHLLHLIVQPLAASSLGDRLQRRSDLLHALVKIYSKTHISPVLAENLQLYQCLSCVPLNTFSRSFAVLLCVSWLL